MQGVKLVGEILICATGKYWGRKVEVLFNHPAFTERELYTVKVLATGKLIALFADEMMTVFQWDMKALALWKKIKAEAEECNG